MTTTRLLTALTLAGALLAAAFLSQQKTPAPTVVMLDPVHVIATRTSTSTAQVVHLPLVEVVGSRAQQHRTLMARQDRPAADPANDSAALPL